MSHYEVEVKITHVADDGVKIASPWTFEAQGEAQLRERMGHGVDESLLAITKRAQAEADRVLTREELKAKLALVKPASGPMLVWHKEFGGYLSHPIREDGTLGDPLWDIWQEGFVAQGQEPQQAREIASDIEAPTFDAAVTQWWTELGEEGRNGYGGKLVQVSDDEPWRYRYSIWGIGLHPTEAEARNTMFG